MKPAEQPSQEGPDSSDDSDFEPRLPMISLQFEQLTRVCDVKFYTGIPSTA